MNGKIHTGVGALAGLGTLIAWQWFEDKQIGVPELLGGALGGALGGRLPDLLEPARSSFHRRFAHSAVATGSLVEAAHRSLGPVKDRLEIFAGELKGKAANAVDWLDRAILLAAALLLDFLQGFFMGLVGGYVSHVFLDALTPRSVPVIGFSHSF